MEKDAEQQTVLYTNIQKLCDEQGTNIYRLEQDAGLPGSAIGNWKEERRWMVYLPAVAKQLHVSIDDLFACPNSQPSLQDEWVKKITTRLNRIPLNEELAEILVEIAETLSAHYTRGL